MYGASGGGDGDEKLRAVARTVRETMMQIFAWMAIGLSFGFGQVTDKPCIGPPAVFPLNAACHQKDVKAYVMWHFPINYDCSTIYVDKNMNVVLVRGWHIDGKGHEDTDNPLLSDNEDCLCRLLGAYPMSVIWEAGNKCDMPNV